MWVRNALKWLKETFPGVYKFFSDFFKGMNNKEEGHSLKRWLTVGMFWLIFHITEENTTAENLEYVLAIHVTAMLSLAGIYTYSNIKTKRLDIESTKTNNNNAPTEPLPQDQGG